MECPRSGIWADSAILQARNLGRRARMNQALRVTVEKRQVERLLEISKASAIGNERTWVYNEVQSPGASPHRSDDIASCAEASEQAEAAQDASCDDQHCQSNQQRCGTTRNAPSMDGDCWLWEERHVCRRLRGRILWCDDLVWCGGHLSSLSGWGSSHANGSLLGGKLQGRGQDDLAGLLDLWWDRRHTLAQWQRRHTQVLGHQLARHSAIRRSPHPAHTGRWPVVGVPRSARGPCKPAYRMFPVHSH
jgi:hypothetical protein